MPTGPFLSHKREDADALECLNRELILRGTEGWQDTRQLRLGLPFRKAFRRAIHRETRGFIWWGTRKSLKSKTVTEEEVPRALRRARRRWRRPYPVVPLFIDLDPGEDRELLDEAFGESCAEALLGEHGAVKRPTESIEQFALLAARQYVHDFVRSHGSRKPLRIAISGKRRPTDDHDLALDWTGELEDGYPVGPQSIERMRRTLVDIRDAAHDRATVPHFVVEPDLRVPLAAMVGWEWNRGRQITFDVRHIFGSEQFTVPQRPRANVRLPEPAVTELDGVGPVILVVSSIHSPAETVGRYAEQLKAGRIVQLHLPERLDADAIARLSDWTVERLRTLNDEGVGKQLIVVGPPSLAVSIGAKAHGTGRTHLPFWDGGSDYRPGIEIG